MKSTLLILILIVLCACDKPVEKKVMQLKRIERPVIKEELKNVTYAFENAMKADFKIAQVNVKGTFIADTTNFKKRVAFYVFQLVDCFSQLNLLKTH